VGEGGGAKRKPRGNRKGVKRRGRGNIKEREYRV